MTSRPQPVSQTSQPQACRHRSAIFSYLASRKHRHHPLGGGLVLPLVLMPRAEDCQPVRRRRSAGYLRRGMPRDLSPTAAMPRPTNSGCSLASTGRGSEV